MVVAVRRRCRTASAIDRGHGVVGDGDTDPAADDSGRNCRRTDRRSWCRRDTTSAIDEIDETFPNAVISVAPDGARTVVTW